MKNNATRVSKRPAKAPATSEPAAKPSASTPCQWSATQEIFIDAISEVLVNGADGEVLNPLLTAVFEQYARKTWGHTFRSQPTEFANFLAKQWQEIQPQWKLDLQMAARLNQRSPEPKKQKPADVAARIKESVRYDVRDLFRGFLQQATTTELYLMRDVLREHDNVANDPHHKSDEVVLAHAFENLVNESTTYVAIPRSMMDRVQVYINALREIEAKD